MPAGLDHIDFVFADNDFFATEDLTTDEVAESVIEETTVDSAFDSDCDDASCALKPVTSAATIGASDTLRMFSRSLEFGQNFGSVGRHGSHNPGVCICGTCSGHAGPPVPEAIINMAIYVLFSPWSRYNEIANIAK